MIRASQLNWRRRSAVAIALLASLAACSQKTQDVAKQLAGLPTEGAIARVPLGDIAGPTQSNFGDTFENPYHNDAGAIAEGKRLFTQMNCAGCHGYDAKGGMGPNLTDRDWRYGGAPINIYKSIYEGRPKGMPAWGEAMPAVKIWSLVAYIQTLGGATLPQDYQAGLQGDEGGPRPAIDAAPPAAPTKTP